MNNIFFLKKAFPHYIHDDECNNFVLITSNFEEDKYYEYFVVNELYHQKFNTNVKYFYNKIYKVKNDCFNHVYSKTQIEIYNKVQRFNLAFSRLLNLIYHKYKKSKNSTNLLLEPLTNNHEVVIDRGVKYSFERFEIFKMIKMAFEYADETGPVIHYIRNPYTNKRFKKHIIINFYFTLLKFGNIPFYFFLYFKHKFSKEYLYENYNYNLFLEHFLEDLKNKFYSLSKVSKLRYIDEMIEGSNYHSFIRADNDDKLEYLITAGKDYYISEKIIVRFETDAYWISDQYVKKYIKKLQYIKNKYPYFGIKKFTLK